MKKLFYATSLAACIAGCGSPSSDAGLTILDVGAAIDNHQTFDLSEIARSIEFIPLDESVPVDEIALLGGLQPSAEGFYVVSASESSPVQHFDRIGRFIGTVGRIGRGPYETIGIVGITANDETGDIYIDGGDAVVGLDATGKGFARNDSILTYGTLWHKDRLLVLDVPSIFDEDAYAGNSIAFISLFDRDLNASGASTGLQ